MKSVIVYESMFGNTRRVAEAIAAGLAPFLDATLVNVNDSPVIGHDIELLIVGGPTHVHGMSRDTTRAEAQRWANDPAKELDLEPGAPGIGVREWLGTLAHVPRLVGAFDTRADILELLSGAASVGIQRALLARGGEQVLPHESFVVHGNDDITNAELQRARDWGSRIGGAIVEAATPTGTW